MQGVLRKGQEIEVRPGIVSRDSEGKAKCVPIYSRIVTLLAEQNDLQYAVPGGLIGVGTTVSPLCLGSTSIRQTVLLASAVCCGTSYRSSRSAPVPAHEAPTAAHNRAECGVWAYCCRWTRR